MLIDDFPSTSGSSSLTINAPSSCGEPPASTPQQGEPELSLPPFALFDYSDTREGETVAGSTSALSNGGHEAPAASEEQGQVLPAVSIVDRAELDGYLFPPGERPRNYYSGGEKYEYLAFTPQGQMFSWRGIGRGELERAQTFAQQVAVSASPVMGAEDWTD